MILVIDNYDSFTFNLVQYVGELNPDILVVRNDKATSEELLSKSPSHIIISPGPCTPREAGISVDLIQKTPASIPLLGVCLGHQSIGEAFGGNVIRAPKLMHGKTSTVRCNQRDLFLSLPESFTATRYHSLIVEKDSLPDELEITSESEDGIIMGVRHKTRPVFGLQFHPESILTQHGKTIVKNFLNMKETA